MADKTETEKKPKRSNVRTYKSFCISSLYKNENGLDIEERLELEDEDGYDVRLYLGDENAFGGQKMSMALADNQVVDLLSALETVAARRGLRGDGGRSAETPAKPKIKPVY